MDMSPAYVSAAKQVIPLAEEKIVHDRFHVMQLATRAVDQVRRAQHRELLAHGDDRLSKTKYVWITSQEHLSEKQQALFDETNTLQLRTGKAWAFKEMLRDLWTQPDTSSATGSFQAWYQRVIHTWMAAPDEIVRRYGDLNDPAAIYSATIDNTDRAIARLVKKLDQIGSLDNTIIIYTSDHGSYRQERNGNLHAGKGSLMEGGTRTPGIIHWPNGIKGGRVESTPAGAVDLLPTICGLVGVEKPDNVHLDGTDLSPLLTGDRSDFKRHQPLTWHSPTSQPIVAIREGKYSLVGWRDKEYPKDQPAIQAIMDSMRVILEKEHGRTLSQSELWHQAWNSEIKTPEWNRLRSRFVMLNTFQEAWIPLIKAGSGGITRFQLYDLSTDPGQQKDIAKSLPEVTKRLTGQLLEINSSVLAEAPVWGTKQQQTRQDTASKQPTAPTLSTEDRELTRLLTRIDHAELPEGYNVQQHQPYVDRRMESLGPEQRRRIGTLWKAKRRLQPKMKNAGMSFVRILEYVAGGEKLPDNPTTQSTPIESDS